MPSITEVDNIKSLDDSGQTSILTKTGTGVGGDKVFTLDNVTLGSSVAGIPSSQVVKMGSFTAIKGLLTTGVSTWCTNDGNYTFLESSTITATGGNFVLVNHWGYGIRAISTHSGCYFRIAIDDDVKTLVNGAVSAAFTTLTVDSTTGFDSSGTFTVCGIVGHPQIITYTGITATTFTGCSTTHATATPAIIDNAAIFAHQAFSPEYSSSQTTAAKAVLSNSGSGVPRVLPTDVPSAFNNHQLSTGIIVPGTGTVTMKIRMALRSADTGYTVGVGASTGAAVIGGSGVDPDFAMIHNTYHTEYTP
jgi:hypothetical protein